MCLIPVLKKKKKNILLFIEIKTEGINIPSYFVKKFLKISRVKHQVASVHLLPSKTWALLL